MDSTLILLVVVVAVAIVAIAFWLTTVQRRRQRSHELKEQFGPEYERAVTAYGRQTEAEKELEQRKERVDQLHIRTLSNEQSTRYASQWHEVQAQFVDDPEQAIAEADRLVVEVMQARGYPMVEFEQRAADVSVDHPDVVEHYRAAHRIAGRSARGEAETEDLRQAMVHYRALFQELIETPTTKETRHDHAA
jgi:antitoxin component HigA of HigAB toxin-antitoxin module